MTITWNTTEGSQDVFFKAEQLLTIATLQAYQKHCVDGIRLCEGQRCPKHEHGTEVRK